MEIRTEEGYRFTLVLTGPEELGDKEMDALFEAGCDDASFGRSHGMDHATFTREAASMREAILSAIADIHKAAVGLEVIRIDFPDLITQNEIAKLAGKARQYIFRLISGERGSQDFPPPIGGIEGDHRVWDASTVADWLVRNKALAADVAESVRDIGAINAALAFRRWNGSAAENLSGIAAVVGA